MSDNNNNNDYKTLGANVKTENANVNVNIKKKKGGAERERDKKKLQFENVAGKCKKITDMLSGRKNETSFIKKSEETLSVQEKLEISPLVNENPDTSSTKEKSSVTEKVKTKYIAIIEKFYIISNFRPL